MTLSSNSTFSVNRTQTEFHPERIGPEPAINWKAISFQQITLTNTSTRWVAYLTPPYSYVTPVSDTFFDSCQMAIKLMSKTKLNTARICLALPASKCDISHPLIWKSGHTDVRTMLSEPKLLRCNLDNLDKVFLPMVFRCARECFAAGHSSNLHNTLCKNVWPPG